MNLYSLLVTSLGWLALVAAFGAAILITGLAVRGSRSRIRIHLRGLERVVLGSAALTSVIAVAGSLYFSEVVGFIPCRLCWYQRIAMYPLLPVLAVALVQKDAAVWRYGLPLALIGLATSAYHVAVQYIPAVEASTCRGDVPCSAIYVAVFGVVSIPVMAGAAFLAITALLFTARTLESAEDSGEGER